jgi:transcriptional regulator with XRE-family HTH domain
MHAQATVPLRPAPTRRRTRGESCPVLPTIGARIRVLRVTHGQSQAAIAQQIGLSHQQLQKYEAGTNHIPVECLHKIALLYGVSLDTFFDDLPPAVPGSVAAAGRNRLAMQIAAEAQSLPPELARALLHVIRTATVKENELAMPDDGEHA